VDRSAIARGETAVSAEFSARENFAVSFTPLESGLAVLRRRTPVRAYIGSAEILGTLVFERVPLDVQAVRATLHLRCRAIAFPGVRFVVRRTSPKTLLGGGAIEAHVAAPSGARASSAEAAALRALRDAGLAALDVPAVAFAANLRETVARAALERATERGDALRVGRPDGYIDGGAAHQLLDRVFVHLEAAQRERPWVLGATSLSLARGLGVDEPLLVRFLSAFVESGHLAGRGGYFATNDHRAALTAQQRTLFEEVVPTENPHSFVPVPFAGIVAAVKRSHIDGAGQALDTLLAHGALVRVGDDCYRGAQVAAIRARVETYLRANERMTAAQFRDLLGTSRKYAVPLLEWLDAHGITLRDGDFRTLRKHQHAAR
jgi:selenocysteine-specific elongation factor